MLYLGLIAAFLISAALVGAWFLRFPNDNRALDVRIFGYWFVMSFLICVLQKPAWIIPLSIPFILVAQPKNILERVPFYFAALFIIPAEANFDIPMIGLNYLMSMDNVKLLSIIIITPLLFVGMPKLSRLRFGLLDFLVLSYGLWTIFLSYRGVPMTTGLRYSINIILIWILPYFAISRLVVHWRVVHSTMNTWLLMSTILSLIAMISIARQWNLYTVIDIDSSFEVEYYRRGGWLRVATTFSTSLFAYFLSVALITLEVLKRYVKVTRLQTWAMRIMFPIAVFMTGSRAGWVMVPICYGLYFIFDQKSVLLKWSALTAGIVGGFISYSVYTQNALSNVDEYGTFQYRRDLIDASMIQIDSAFWAGDADYLNSEHLAHMVQGQGIIDIVNSYLQIALRYGVVGFILFVSMIGVACFSLFRIKASWGHLAADEQQWLRDWRAVLLAALIALSLLFVTTSMVSYTVSIFMVLLALTRGMSGQVKKGAESGTGFFNDFKSIPKTDDKKQT